MEHFEFDHIQSTMNRHAHHQVQLTRMCVAEKLAYLDAIQKEMETDWEYQDDPVNLLRRQGLL